MPLDEIFFDTFDGGSVSLADASPEQINSLRDAIPPIDDPRYSDGADNECLSDDDIVLGYVGDDGTALAYPHKILNFHEIVNDTIDGRPVLVSYCPLCRSGIVYDRRLGDRELTFGNTSALYENDLVMLDRQTGSYWWQVAGQAIVGPMTGESLSVLPSTTTTWGQWRELHPDTAVLSRDTGYPRDYDRDPFLGYGERVNAGQTPFPVSEDVLDDSRLDPATLVVGVDVEDVARGYPVGERSSVYHDTIGTDPIVVFADGESSGGAAFYPRVDGEALRFEARDGIFVDTATGSEWDLSGRAIDGPLRGQTLNPVASRSTFWFAFVAAFPNTAVASPED